MEEYRSEEDPDLARSQADQDSEEDTGHPTTLPVRGPARNLLRLPGRSRACEGRSGGTMIGREKTGGALSVTQRSDGAEQTAGAGDDKSMAETGTELVGLIAAYAKQETLDPLKALARFLVYGLVGSMLVATGGFLVTLGVVRLLQTETGPHLKGHLTWVPYLGGLLFALVVAAVAASRMFKAPR